MKARNFLYASTAFLVLAIAFTVGMQLAARQVHAASAPAGVSAPIAEQLQNEFADVAAKVNPTVVNIDVEKPMNQPAYGQWQLGPNMPIPPELRQFFNFPGPGDQGGDQGQDPQPRRGRRPGQGQGQGQPPVMRAAGSGVIIDAKRGYIVTNNHVVKDATKVGVTLIDGSNYEAKVVGTDPMTDLAVVQIDAKEPLTEIELGDASSIKVGHIVLAFGQPEGLKYTVTQGIVSATGRANLGIINEPGTGVGYEDFIQTDAAVNPGNSGGPLTDIHGKLIGINSAIATAGVEQFGGISFAIPISIVRTVVPQLIEHGEVTRGYIGVHIANLSDLAGPPPQSQLPKVDVDAYGTGGKGVYVADVMPNGPAEKAGLKSGDVITGFAGERTDDTVTLRNDVAAAAVGKAQPIDVVRLTDGKPQKMSFDIEIARQPAQMAAETPGVAKTDIGMVVQTLTPQLAQALGIDENEQGVVVTAVEQDSRAAKAGIQPGDIISQIRYKAQTYDVASAEDLTTVLGKIAKDESFAVRVLREGQYRFVPIP